MYTALAGICLALLFGADASQASPPAPPVGSVEASPEHLMQLANCRSGILDPNARAKDRRRWIETLLAFDTVQARALVVELLQSKASPPAARQSLCEVIADSGRRSPQRVDPTFIEPLIILLSADAEDLRSAAARALADFPGTEVPARLGAIAGSDAEPLATRLAAIDALAAKVSRRGVVQELIELLSAGEPEITSRAITALEPAAREPIGADIERWRKWWSTKAEISEEQWLADRLDMYTDRYREHSEGYAAFKLEARQREEALASRLAALHRELFRGLTAEQREAKLAEWLGDPLPEVRQSALKIIQARIADEGTGPDSTVLTALLQLLDSDSPDMRREVVVIVQNLRDPTVVQAVLTRLDKEADSSTRLAIFRALGKLKSPAAIPALIREIQSTESTQASVREAADALAQIAELIDDKGQQQDAVAALQMRYQNTAVSSRELRAALLSAMAGVGDPSFAPEFLRAIDSTDVIMLRPAIRGLAAIGDRSKVLRIRALTADADALVRLAAVEAIAELGNEDADIESVLTRINPGIETNELVREAAWRAFRTVIVKRPTAEQISAAERLRETPDLEVRFLAEMSNRLSIANGHRDEAEYVRERLATLLVNQLKYDRASPHLRELFEAYADRDDARAFDTGLRWLDCALRSRPQQNVPEAVLRLSQLAQNEDQHARVFATVEGFLDSLDVTEDTEEMRRLLIELRPLEEHVGGENWKPLLDRFASRLGSEPNENSTAPPG